MPRMAHAIDPMIRGARRPQDMPPAEILLAKPDPSKIMAAIVPPVLLILRSLGPFWAGSQHRPRPPP